MFYGQQRLIIIREFAHVNRVNDEIETSVFNRVYSRANPVSPLPHRPIRRSARLDCDNMYNSARVFYGNLYEKHRP